MVSKAKQLKPSLPAGTRVLITLASFVIVVAGMKAASAILVPFFLAMLISIICAPALYWLQRKGIPKGLAVGLIIIIILSASSLLGLFVGNSMNEFMSKMPQIEKSLNEKTADFRTWLESREFVQWLEERAEAEQVEAEAEKLENGESQPNVIATPKPKELFLDSTDVAAWLESWAAARDEAAGKTGTNETVNLQLRYLDLVNSLDAQIKSGEIESTLTEPKGTETKKKGRIFDDLFDGLLDPGFAMRMAGNMLSNFTGLLTNAFLILLTVVFILLEASSFPGKLKAALDDPEKSLTGLNTFLESVNRYLVIKTIFSLITGLLVFTWLTVTNVGYPLLWGFLAFLLNFVPNIGSIIAAIPAVLMALIQFGPGKAMVTALGFIIVNIAIGSITEPRFMGRGLGLSTLVVFLSLVFWGWVLGPVGMLLSVLLTMILKIALESNDDTRWMAIMLGPEPTFPK